MNAERGSLFISALISAFIAGLVLAPHAHAQTGRHLIYIGGGGEDAPPAEQEIPFDEHMKKASKFFRSRGYQMQAYYDGAFADSRQASRQSFGEASTEPLRENSLQRELDRIQELISQGKIKPGDQFLFMIDTHGTNQGTISGSSPRRRELTHQISTGVPSDGWISLDELAPIRNALERAGARIGVIDLSCFSGATQTLASEKTCVISGAGARHLSYPAILMPKLIAEFRPGRSLEDVFLRARRKSEAPGMPEISTPEGRAARRRFFRLEEAAGASQSLDGYAIKYEYPACRNWEEDLFAQVTRLESDILEILEEHSPPEAGFGGLLERLGLREKPLDAVRRESTALRDAVREYSQLRMEYDRILNALHTPESTRKEMASPGTELTWRQIAEGTIEKEMDRSNSMLEGSTLTASRRGGIEQVRLNLQEFKKSRIPQLRKQKAFADIESGLARLPTLKDEITQAAVVVSRHERRLYDLTYRALRNDAEADGATSDACQDFEL